MKKRFMPFVIAGKDINARMPAMAKIGTAEPEPLPLDQQLADAFNANNAVLAYVGNVIGTNLPVLPSKPDWYQKFASDFANAKTHAMSWYNSVTPGLTSIPQGIINYGNIFSLNMSTMQQALNMLIKDSGNTQARQTLKSSLISLVDGLEVQLDSIDKQQALIDTFSNNLSSDAAQMSQAIDDAKDQQGYDKEQVGALLKHIDELQKEIDKNQVIVAASAIGAGVAFFAGAVTAIFSFGLGLAFGIIGAAAGITAALLASAKIKELQLKITADTLKMDEFNQEIATLESLQKSLSTLIQLSQDAGKQLDQLTQAWQEMRRELMAVIHDLESAESALDESDFQKLQQDLNAAQADWDTLTGFCQTMAGIQYNKAEPETAILKIGETEAA